MTVTRYPFVLQSIESLVGADSSHIVSVLGFFHAAASFGARYF